MRGVIMVGDSVANDVGFGKAAGASTALVDSGRRVVEGGGDGGADLCVPNLALLPQLLWQHFDLETSSPVTPGSQKFSTPAPGSAGGLAAAKGDVAALALLTPDEIDATDPSGNTPLIWAAVRAVGEPTRSQSHVRCVGPASRIDDPTPAPPGSFPSPPVLSMTAGRCSRSWWHRTRATRHASICSSRGART